MERMLSPRPLQAIVSTQDCCRGSQTRATTILNSLCGPYLDIFNTRSGLGNWLAILAQAVDVKFDSLLD